MDDFFSVDEPLIGQHRFDDNLGAVAEGLHDGLVFDQRDQGWGRLFGPLRGFIAMCGLRIMIGIGHHDGEALGRDLGYDLFACFEPVEAAQVIGHQVDGVGFGFA